jgi:hypothetical protein
VVELMACWGEIAQESAHDRVDELRKEAKGLK